MSMKDIHEKKTDLEFAEAQVRAGGERPSRDERQESQTDAISVRDTPKDDQALLSPNAARFEDSELAQSIIRASREGDRKSGHTLLNDEARIAALDDACGVNLQEE